MTRILAVSDLWLPFPGGAERLMFNVTRALMRDGHDVAAVTGYEHAQRFDGPPVVADEIPLDGDGWYYIECMIAAFAPDVLLTHHVYARTFAEQMKATGLPTVQLVLNGDRLPDAALAVYISKHVRTHCTDQRPCDLTMTPPAFAEDVEAGSHGDAIGFIKPIEHKGVDLFYEIVDRLPQYRYVVLRGEWQTLERICPHPSITFMEPVDDIRDFWRECRAVLVPSISEDAGTVAQEATLNGLPCVSSDVQGLSETNRGGLRISPLLGVDAWCSMIRNLDNPAFVEIAVERQRRYLVSQDHAGKLAALSRAIAAL